MTKIVVWDFDGPINLGSMAAKVTKTSNHAYSTYDGKEVTGLEIYIQPLHFLKTTLEILSEHNVISVLGSQRIAFKNSENADADVMYNVLNEILGSERKYLQEQEAKKIGQDLCFKELKEDKSPILNKYYETYLRTCAQLNKKDIILVDDYSTYQASTEKSGYGFIHAPREYTSIGSEADQAYLFNVLCQIIEPEKVLATLNVIIHKEQNDEIKNELNQYKEYFVSYLVDKHPLKTKKLLKSYTEKNKQNQLIKKVNPTFKAIDQSEISAQNKITTKKNILKVALLPESKTNQENLRSHIQSLKKRNFSKKKVLIGALEMFAGFAITVASVIIGVSGTATGVGAATGIGIMAVGIVSGLTLFANGAQKASCPNKIANKKINAIENFINNTSPASNL